MSARTRKALSPAKRVKRSPPATGNSMMLWLGLLGLGGFALFKSRSAAAQSPAGGSPAGGILSAPITTVGPVSLLPIQAGTQNIPELPGSMAVTAPTVQGALSFWDTLNPGGSMSSGYINFPSGSQVAATLFQTRYDGYGSPYVQWAGLTYILTGPDVSGNYSATQVMTG